MQLAVLNPGGNDREQSFPDFAGDPDIPSAHPPVNYHAYAACTAGTFYRDPAHIPTAQRDVLLVLRRDLKHCLRVLRKLKSDGKTVAVSLKESGLHQLAKLFTTGDNLRLFREICALADGCIASTQDLVSIYQSAGGRSVRFIPTPYPVDTTKWDFALPIEQRAGIFIGTREWGTPSRNHASALLLAASLNCPVTVVNEEGRMGRKRLTATGIASLNIIEGRRAYPDYLRLIATHRIVLQLDRSAVPGQVAGDSLLCNLPCVGGDGAIERIAYPDLCGHHRDSTQLREKAQSLLRDDTAYAAACEKSRDLATKKLSFPAIAEALTTYFDSIATLL